MNLPIKITVKTYYVPERSKPVQSYYFFAYHITIENVWKLNTQLLSRFWHITDGEGNTEDVHGPGVIGKTPKLAPGESFEYTSYCPLPTPMGFMEGSFRMMDEMGKEFDVVIEPFRLIAPQVLN